MAKLVQIIGVALLLALYVDKQDHGVVAEPLEDAIGTWAQEFGEELWQLGQTVTKLTEIKSKYKAQNAEVKQRTGEELLSEIVENVQTMLNKKVDAVKCIMNEAEDLAEEFDETERIANYTYYSSKKSVVNGEWRKEEDDDYYKPMWLQAHRKFDNVPINTSHSAVHLPTNLFDRSAAVPNVSDAQISYKVMDAIQWTEGLHDVFLNNYNGDPALSWQYFAHNTGFLRQFPAMRWNQDVDQFDFRFSQSYIDSATCSKDMLILMDTTGSMTGMRMRIAKLTVSNLLDTLSNNDYVNIFNFSSEAEEIVPCFKDTLVQATPQNINTFKEALDTRTANGSSNFSVVMTQAFKLLQRYREERGCNETGPDSPQCSQTIMLITDEVPFNITEVFEEYNWFENGTNIPVRVFTYLIGREVFQVKEIQLIACMNKGYYSHIHSLDEVREGVFEYVPVLARPLVLQGVEHPITWTNVHADIANSSRMNEWMWDVMENGEQKDRMYKYFRNKKVFFSQRDSDRRYVQQMKKEMEESEGHIRYREYHLVMGLAMPVFDRKINQNNRTGIVDLLGVAGTDISLDHIESLTNPYKIGVDGYAFIIDNNGFLLLHPDLRPVSRGALKNNSNSVDLTEVEFLDDDGEYREIASEIEELREAMVNQLSGKMEGLTMKFHYDDMHRVAIEERNYFYAPMEGTPFTVGLSLPSKHGFNYLSVRDEVKKAQFLRVPLMSYFFGYNWKLRPDWVYCKYHHEHMFNSTEQEMRHFFERMSASDWKWYRQYKEDKMDKLKYSSSVDESDYEFAHCKHRDTVDAEEYYCNKELILLLIFDAKVTSSSFENPRWEFKNKKEEELIFNYNTTLRFISTQSGLTRWQYMLESDEKEYHRTEFGNLHKRSIDESWYVSAVQQHHIDPDSFVYSLSFDLIGVQEGEAMITASHAIFHRDGGKEAPASVIGLQFRQTALYDRFMKISSNAACSECREQCSSEQLDCYVLDSGGYILISENINDTGRFFGEVDGAAMEAMINENIYRRVTIFDYQALCFEEILKRHSDASGLLTPLKYFQWMLEWFVGELMWIIAQTSFHELWTPVASVPVKGFPYDLEEEYYDSVEEEVEEEIVSVNQTEKEKTIEYETINHPCDQKIDLYLLEQENLKRLHKEGYGTAMRNCSRPFYLRRIPHSNLLLVVVDAMYPSCYRKLSVEPEELHSNATYYACQKLNNHTLLRIRPTGCFAQHPAEEEITECGDIGSIMGISLISLTLSSLLILFTNSLQF